MKKTVTHLTSAHPRFDTRIFYKMCCSLSSTNKYYVNLVVADGLGDDLKNDVIIHDVGKKSNNRFKRFTETVSKVYKKAIKIDSELYHLHDPELMPIGIFLILKGKKVVFDAHEDLPNQVLGKPYLSNFLRSFLSKLIPFLEFLFLNRVSGVVGATPIIANKFKKINRNVVNINNFPILSELDSCIETKKRQNEICYVGGIDRSRGIFEIVESLKFGSDIILNLAGNFKFDSDKTEIYKMPEWKNVKFWGYQNREGVVDIYKKSNLGLVLLHPQINYIESLPVKMFEYMAAGIPVISSDFPIWKKIIEENNCGICVNPLDPKEIYLKIKFLLNRPDIRNNMGKNGQKAIITKYNWGVEEIKLFDFYTKLLK